ncbi:MAG TPA: ERCC4 domain-containing protein [Terrimicrobiaceae bacterium]
MNKTLLIADDREVLSGVPDLLAQMPEVELRIEHLAAGDYRVEESVLIERKTASDFAHSLVTGRLFEQAARMTKSEFRPAYIIEGQPADWIALGVRREALQGALITLMMIFDIPVLRATDASETARLILYTGQQLARLRDPNHAPYRQMKAKRKRTRQLRLLQALPGVGSERARLLLDHFGSLRACFEARRDELQEIDGIGPGTAQAILDTIQEASPAYSNRSTGRK